MEGWITETIANTGVFSGIAIITMVGMYKLFNIYKASTDEHKASMVIMYQDDKKDRKEMYLDNKRDRKEMYAENIVQSKMFAETTQKSIEAFSKWDNTMQVIQKDRAESIVRMNKRTDDLQADHKEILNAVKGK